ncbi:hypothetical protein B9479_006957 [Cryptococcus floricola]|uniref:H/ACA ribonucleoprotein complex non-core subunit NAF1 n=1 Tax=Cryptococcus floricola TaxID=2591691 RepID=A0A5D3ART2_9TREE|nr:hypothetical protein B9479_006957 [Cryptococcus floricola]
MADNFKAPANPNVPQDIAHIMELVATDQVVGAMPSVDMSAAEKRKLVEESIKQGKVVKPESESDSDSSSEFESSSEEESDKEPLTAEKHQELKAELDEFVKDGEVEWDSDSDEGINLDKMGFEFMEDEDEPAGGPIASIHEAPLPPVKQPPLIKLPDGEGVSLAGDVVSWMREKKVEAWLEINKMEGEDVQAAVDAQVRIENPEAGVAPEGIPATASEDTPVTATESASEVPEAAPVIAETAPKPVKEVKQPNFSSSGTVVVRAMQSRPGDHDEGWLEEGSVLCWEDGRVLGTVHETFGPLTSPFYTVRLPPPPFPYPSPESLVPGSRLFYPLNNSYRSFVNMIAVRDPRFKGTDASNLYDEEVGDDEVEWSDDEAEAAAKREKKNKKGKKGKKGGSIAGTPRALIAGLPARPHFDYQPDDASDAGSMYGGDDERWEMGSDAGSTVSRGRPAPMPYDLDEPNGSAERGGRRGRGRGQGRERGRGRGRGGHGGQSTAPMQQQQSPMDFQYQQQPFQPYPNQWQQPFMPSMPMPGFGFQPGFPQMMDFQQPPQTPQYGGYTPNQPSGGMPAFGQQQPQQQAQQQQQPQGVAINPRFAAQYQAMMGMGQSMQGGMGQGGEQGGQNGAYGQGQYGYGQYQQQ